ncbi:MAG TPA: MazG nucleotide pyrophosphohydrolase domain-containing protein [Acidimicrobiia bacterium]|nr:MazG nucleotide pyrophosphohydrolase domain-containing protein [Acidimicrobiia bacterium]
MEITEFQRMMERTYGDRDRARGIPASVAWLTEEVGELAQSLRKGDPDQQSHEFADVLAWTFSLANQAGIDIEGALDRYAHGCPKCGSVPCNCT